MSGWAAHIVDVNGAFLLGEFKENEHIYMKVPKGFERFYSSDVLLYLRKTLYSVKNAAKAFWRLLLGIMNSMGYKRNRADPCLYYKWDSTVGLIMWISFIDDMLVVCNEKYMDDVKQKFTNTVDCDDMGAMVEYIGTKIDIDKTKRELKITQPVLVQSLRDEFEFENPNNCPETPAPASTHLMASGKSLSPEKQTKYRSGVGKLLYLTKWSRPEIANSVRESTRFMTRAYPANYKAMERVMQHVLSTPDRGVIMQPDTDWDGNNEFLFTVDGMSDSGDATEPESRRRCGGLQVFLNKSPLAHKSKMQSSASLSMAEGELIAACDAAQIMLFVMHVLEDMGLRVKKPMILRVDCKGAIDLTYGWNVSGLTKHASIKACFLRELKEANTVLCVWMPTTANLTDMYTKNLTQQLYDRHRSTIVRDNNDDDDKNKDYLRAILATSHINNTNSPGEGPPVGVGIGSLPMTPNKNGEIGVLCVESDLVGTGRHNKT